MTYELFLLRETVKKSISLVQVLPILREAKRAPFLLAQHLPQEPLVHIREREWGAQHLIPPLSKFRQRNYLVFDSL